jgi:hypothetical protein
MKMIMNSGRKESLIASWWVTVACLAFILCFAIGNIVGHAMV